jgi:uncharacterized protein (TIGR02453 family)
MAERFTGFPPGGIAFLAGLAVDNTRSYFDAHRHTYEHDLAVPIRLLVTDVAERLRATIAPALQADPTVGKSLFRINRDLRFSKDKTPYHPWIDAVWWEGLVDARQAPAFIFRLAADHIVLGAGIMGLRGSQLERYRRAVADPRTGQALRSILDQLRAAGPDIEITEPDRKRVPAPYPPDHPRGDLLRRDSLHASRRLAHPSNIDTSRFSRWTADHLSTFRPLHQWLVNHLTP